MNKKILSSFIWRFGERIGAQLVTFIVSIILARLLSPSDYGTIALVTVFITIANVFVSDGLGSSLIQKKETDNIDYSSVFYFNIVFSWLIYVIIFFVAPYIAKFYDDEIITPILRVIALRIPIAGINSVQEAYVTKNLLFKRFFYSTLIGTVVSAFVGIILAIQGFGVWALAGQYLLSSVMNTIILWFTVKWRPDLVFSFERIAKLFKYGWKVLLSSLINQVYENIRSLIIGKVYTSNDLAFFSKGKQYPFLIIINIDSSINSVLFPALSLYQDDLPKIKKLTKNAIKMSTYIIFPLMAGMAMISEPLVRVMLTEKWLPVVPYMTMACLYLATIPLSTTNVQAIKAIGRSDVYLKLEIITKTIGLIALLVVMDDGVMAISYSLFVYYFFATLMNSFAAKKYINYGLLELLKDISPNVLLTLTMMLAVKGGDIIFNSLEINYITSMILQILIGGLTYILASSMFKSTQFEYIKNFFKKNKRQNVENDCAYESIK